MSQQNLTRIEYTGEISGPGCEIVVVDDDIVEVDESRLNRVSARVIATIAVTAFIEDGLRERGFMGEWRSVEPDQPPVPVRLVGLASIGNAFRVTADTHDEAVAAQVKTKPGHRHYLKLVA